MQVRPQLVVIKGLVAEVGAERQPFEQRRNALGIVPLTRQQDEVDQIAQHVDKSKDFRCQAATRASNSLMLSSPFAPVAFWWTRLMVPSAMIYSKFGSPRSTLNIRSTRRCAPNGGSAGIPSSSRRTRIADRARAHRCGQSTARPQQTGGCLCRNDRGCQAYLPAGRQSCSTVNH